MVIAISGMSGLKEIGFVEKHNTSRLIHSGSQVATSRRINLHLIDASKEGGE
jgi:hypothetical protein